MNGIIDSGTIGRAVVVLGATGAAGRGVVQALVEAGRPLVAVAEDADALRALADAHPGAALATLPARIASDADAALLASRLRASGVAIDGVVAGLSGEHACGRLIDEPADVLQRALDEDLLPHLFAARHLLPLLEPGAGGYVLVGGAGGTYPWAGYGHCSIAAAALRMMARVLHDEAARHGLRVQLLSLDAPLRADAAAARSGRASAQALALGRRALALLDGGHAATAQPIVRFSAVDLPMHAMNPVPARVARRRDVAAGQVLPARDLHAARALLDSIASPTPPGHFLDEHC